MGEIENRMIYGMVFLTLIWEFILMRGIYVMIVCPHREIEWMNWISKLAFVIRSIVSLFYDMFLNCVIDRPKKKQGNRFLIFIILCVIVLKCSLYAIDNYGKNLNVIVLYIFFLYVLYKIDVEFYNKPSRIDRIIDERIEECSDFDEFEKLSRLGKDMLPLLSMVRPMACMLFYGVIGFVYGFNIDQISEKCGLFMDIIRTISDVSFDSKSLNFPTLEAFIMGSILYVYLSAFVIPNYIYYSAASLKIEKMKERRDKLDRK